MDYTKIPSSPAGRGSYTPGSGAMGGVGSGGRSSNGNGLPIYAPSASSPAVTAIPAAGGTQAVTGPAAAAAPYGARKRRANSGERLRLAMALVITLSYLGLSGVMFAFSMGETSAGFTAQLGSDGRGVVTYVVPSGPAYDAGVRPGDTVSGTTNTNPSAVEAVNLDFRSSDDVQPHQVAILDDSPLRRWTYALLGLIFIGVGGPVFVKARQRTAASTFYALCTSTALAFAVATGTVSGLGWVLGLSFMNIVLFAGAFAFFFFKFPIQVGKTPQRHALILSAVVIAGLVPIANYGWVLLGHIEAFDLARSLMLLFLAGCVTAGVINLGRSWFAERSPEVRRQLVLLLGGTAFGVGPALFLFVIPSLLFKHSIVSMDVAAMALGIMPLAFAYAITQHQLLGARNFIRRGVVYLVMGSSVLLAFSLAAAALGSVAEGWEKQELGLIGFSFFVFLLAFSYSYLQRRVEHLVDRFIYHDAYDYKEALLQFSSQLASEQKLQVLADELVERTCRLMNLMSGVLLVAVHPDENARANRSWLRPGLISGFLNSRDAAQAEHRHAYGLEVPGLWSSENDPLAAQVPAGGNNGFYLELYSKYGEFADQLTEDLQDELSAMGIQLHEGDTSRASVRLAGTRGMCATDSVRKVASLADAVARPDVSEVMKAGSLGETTGKLDFDAVRSFLGVPLWTRSRFVGVLCLTGKKTGERFTKDDLSLLSTLGSQAALAIYNAQLHEAREQALLDTITALAHAIEAKDGYTIQHCERMTGRAIALAQALDLPRQEVENVRLGAILHDVGKIGIPDAVLNKPSKLTPEEYEIVKEHAAIGARIVQSVGALKGVVPIVHHHQERYDGSGYPLGLAGEDIPIGARIIGVVDTYGAMTEDRVYRKAPGHEAALDELQRLAGKQFDPIVVRAFVQLLTENPDLAELEYSHAS